MNIPTCHVCCMCFSRSYNLKRHLYNKHNIDSTLPALQNSQPAVQNSQPVVQNSNIPVADENEVNKCPKCDKTLSQKSCVKRHLTTCKGIINKLECEYCKCTFTHTKSRYKHYKTCKEKNKPATEPLIINNNTNINSHNNTTNNTTNNNNTVNITVVYKIGDETIDFNREHFTENVLKKILACKNNTASIHEYVTQMFANPENRFIKKHSLREPHSQLHLGDNKWKHVLDKDVYPDLASTFANDMLEYMYTKQHALRRTAFEKLRDTLDYLADNGYKNTDDKELQKRIENEFKTFVKNLKLIVHDINSTTD